MGKRSSVKINKSVVDGLSYGDTVWDSQLTGFGVRCLKNRKSYVLKTMLNGQQKLITIGAHGMPWTPDQARKKAILLLGETVQGRDPTDAARKRRARTKTIADLAEKYLAEHAEQFKKASSVRMDRANIKNHIIPLIGKKKISQLSRLDVEELRNDIKNGKTAPADPDQQIRAQGGGSAVSGGEGVANRCLALLSKMMELANQWQLRTDNLNPVKGVKRYKEKPKERFLLPHEFKTLGQAMNEMRSQKPGRVPFLDLVKLLMLTGARCGELQTAKWEYVNLERARIDLPETKTGKRSIQLSSEAVEMLRAIPREEGNPYIFIGGIPGYYLVNVRKPWAELCEIAGLENLRIHDLRHSFASQAMANGTSLAVVGKMLGHKRISTTERYSHLADEQVSAENEKIGSNIAGFLG